MDFPDPTVLLRVAVTLGVFVFAAGTAVVQRRRCPRVSWVVGAGGLVGVVGLVGALGVSPFGPHDREIFVVFLLALGVAIISVGVFLDRGRPGPPKGGRHVVE